MSETVKHTEGPWLAAERSAGAHIHSDHGEIAWLRSNMGISNEEIEANARLIASAPDLLHALEDLLHAYSKPDRRLCCDGRDCGCMGSTVHQQAEHYARAAITKAGG